MVTQLNTELPQIKTHSNGNGHHGRRERVLAADIDRWVGEPAAVESLRREQLRQLAELRAEIYRNARTRGLTPTMLRAASLARK